MRKALEEKTTTRACAAATRFLNEVAAQQAKNRLTAAQASQLVAGGTALGQLLDC